MGLLNITVSTTIAILYNLLVHHLTSMTFRDMPYEEKINKSITFILVAGILGVVMSKMLFKPKKKDKKNGKPSVVSNGLWLGGLLLIVTSIFVNWQTMSDDIKLIMVAATLFGLIYYSKKTLEDDSEEDGKDEEKDDLEDLD